VANYGGGSVACLPINDDGSLRPATGFVQHQGSSVNPQRQKEPHAHSINLDSSGRYALAADLGLDRVLIYRLDNGRLIPAAEPFASVAPGAGPRHLALHPNGRYAYVINELGNTVTAFDLDSRSGALKEIQAISTLPGGFGGQSYTAEVVVHPNGKFLYGSNRGHDSLAIFRLDPESGKMTPAGHRPTQGKFPRNFAIDPSGAFLLAANQESDSVVVFRIDPGTGALTPTGQTLDIGKPVCVRFTAVK
jgi:6-phosphogluconolactonase